MTRKMKYKSSMIAVMLLFFAAMAATKSATADDNWDRIGKIKLKANKKEDSVHIGMEEGWYRWIKFEAEGGRVDFDRVTVVFRDGDKEKFDNFTTLGDGDETRNLAVAVTLKRFIKRIEFDYEIRGDADEVEVKILGRKGDKDD